MRNGVTGRGSRPRLTLVAARQPADVSPFWHDMAAESPEIEIHEARSSADREKLDRFLRRVYVKDMTRNRLHADYRLQSAEDELDSGGVRLIACYRSDIVGTVRINYASKQDLGVNADFYRMRQVAGSNHPSRTCIFSRLLVDPALRGRTLGQRLSVSAYKHALDANARTAFLLCNDQLIYYFSALGFKSYMGKTCHTEYGEVLPMKLDLLDETYLAMINSPFLGALRDWKRFRQPGVQIVPTK